MSELIDNITSFQPVYRVLHREKNLDFFREVLGLKVLMEEGAMVWLGGHGAKLERFQLEESPGFHSVKGSKKHVRTVIKAEADELTQLLARDLDKISKIYQGKTGFAFEVISPEDDIFLVTSDLLTDLSALTEIEKSEITVVEDSAFVGLSDFEIIALDLNVSSGETIEYYESIFGVKAIENCFEFPFVTLRINVVTEEVSAVGDFLDLEFLIFLLNKNFDLRHFAEQFSEEDGTYLDASAKTFSLEVPDGIEFWFVK